MKLFLRRASRIYDVLNQRSTSLSRDLCSCTVLLLCISRACAGPIPSFGYLSSLNTRYSFFCQIIHFEYPSIRFFISY